MSCNSYDWKAYALGELPSDDRRQAKTHASTCEGCRGELAHVRLTLDSLSALREEEIPRRIAFVSDKVFEPRWWQTFLRPSFAAALVIALAILAHGFLMRPSAVDNAAIQASVNQAVTKAVADVEQRHAEQMAAMAADYEVAKKYLTSFYVVNTGLVRQ
jgi:anti-sigma factor RsiW